MNKVLLIAYHFPPLGGGGVFRTLKFTKYLPEFGYQPHVLTVKNPMYRIKDPTLIREIPPSAKVYRTFSFEHIILRAPRLLGINLKWFYVPDENIGWLPSAVRQGEKIIRKANIDIVYATAPIFTSFLIGFLLKMRLIQLTQCASFQSTLTNERDPLTLSDATKQSLVSKEISKWILPHF